MARQSRWSKFDENAVVIRVSARENTVSRVEATNSSGETFWLDTSTQEELNKAEPRTESQTGNVQMISKKLERLPHTDPHC